MQDSLQLASTKYRLLISIYERIDTSMDLEEIFEVIFSELFSTIQADMALVQILTAEERKNYYGYQKDESIIFWEPNELFACPAFMNEIITTISDMPADNTGKTVYSFSNTIYAELRKGNQQLGFMAINLLPLAGEPINESILDMIEAVVEQVQRIYKHQDQHQ